MHYAEVREDGKQKFFEVLVTSIHNLDHGSIVGLLCLPSNHGAYLAGFREFPLFLNSLAAKPLQVAIEKGGLPHALEVLERLHEHDLRRIYVVGLDDAKAGGEFLLVDERTGAEITARSTFPQALGVAVRYRQPFLLERGAILASNTDFIDRMLLNPRAREVEGDAEKLAELAARMRAGPARMAALRNELIQAVEREEYLEASDLKHELEELDKDLDVELLEILRDLKDFYLHRVGIFFRL